MHTQRGFIGVGLLVAIILGVVVLGGGAYFVMQQNSSSQTASEDSQNDFLPNNTLPTKNTASNQVSNTQPTPSAKTPASPTTDKIANWKTYRNDVWGIEFKYPSNFVLNTVPHEFWKKFSPYTSGDNFFELIDAQKGCYVGPAKAVGLGYAPSKESSIRTFNGNAIEVKYWTSSNGAVLFGIINHIIPNSGLSLEFTVTSLSGDLIESNYKNTSASHSISDLCVKDFETILTTLKFTKQSSQSAPTLIPDIIKITAPNGGETLKIGDAVRVSWDAKNVPGKYVGLRLEVWQISGDKPIIGATGECSNCIGGGMITLSNPVSSDGLANGAGSVDWVVGKKLYPLHTPPGPGNNYVLMAVAERGNTDEESEQRCKDYPSGVCGKPFSVLLGVDYSDRVFSITN